MGDGEGVEAGVVEDLGEEGGVLCEGGCFVAGTQVQMADGSTKSIDKIKVGDEVKSRDPATGKDKNEPVLRLYIHPAPQIMELHLSDGEVITCTPEHRFYVPSKGFEEAGTLSDGDRLVHDADATAPGTKSATITPPLKISDITWDTKATSLSTATTVYNFEVASTHTYFVGSKLGGVWVHNNCTDEASRIINDQGGEVYNVNRGGWPFWMNGEKNYFHDVVVQSDGSVIDTFTYGSDTPVSLEQWQTDWQVNIGGGGSWYDGNWSFDPGSGEPTYFNSLMGKP
jgi:hypothetical protein